MPQVFQVLRCYKCSVFQVHQTKKSNKWQCKLCGEKQSVKRHYGIGTGKDCRLHVQKLNQMRGDKEQFHENITDSDEEINSEAEISDCNIPDPKSFKRKNIENSKWNTYIEDSVNLDTDNIIDKNESDLDDRISLLVKSHNKKPKYTKIRKKLKNLDNFHHIIMTADNNENEQLINTNNNQMDLSINKVKTNQMHKCNFASKIFLDSGCNNTSSSIKQANVSNMNKMNDDFAHVTHANNIQMKNSKWLNYLNENDELSNSSNESIYLTSEDTNIDKLQNNTVFKNNNNNEISRSNSVKSLDKSKSSKDTQIENLKQNVINDIECPGQEDVKIDKNSFNADKIHIPQKSRTIENDIKEKNSINMFSLCEDNDLDSILNI